MNIFTVGINYKNTPIEVRERFSLSPAQQDLLLSELKSHASVIEAFVLSTCNRVEIYAHLIDGVNSPDVLFESIFRAKDVLPSQDFRRHFYRYEGLKAIEHLLEVAAGLDSMVIGEKEILGQVRDAFFRARDRGMLGRDFNILCNTAIRTGKKARHETNISIGGSSVSWAAIQKAQEHLGPLDERSILVIGAGQMSDMAVGHIQNKGFKELYLMNRTRANAQVLSDKYGGTVVSFFDMKEILAEVDVCICSVSAPHYILEKEIVARVMPSRAGKPLLFIDISMPRNIDPRVAEVEGVSLYQIDDLKEVVDSNMKVRQEAVQEVRDIIRQKISEFLEKADQGSSLSANDEHPDWESLTSL